MIDFLAEACLVCRFPIELLLPMGLPPKVDEIFTCYLFVVVKMPGSELLSNM